MSRTADKRVRRVPKVGDLCQFIPAALLLETSTKAARLEKLVTGRVVYVNLKHRHFLVAYELHGKVLHESLKF